MNKCTILLACFCFAIFQSGVAQNPVIKAKPKVTTKTTVKSNIKVNATASTISKAVPFHKNLLRSYVNRMLIAKLKIRLDKENSFIQIGRKKNILANLEREVRSIAHTWKYYPLDINSTDASFRIGKGNEFKLIITFEGEGSEIKGVCPGCRPRFQDRRAPDMQWENPRKVEINMEAIPYNNSITFKVKNVEIKGSFSLNGPLDEMMPHINFFTYAIRELIEKEMQVMLNDKSIKDQIASEFAAFLRPLGINTVSRLSFDAANMLVHP